MLASKRGYVRKAAFCIILLFVAGCIQPAPEGPPTSTVAVAPADQDPLDVNVEAIDPPAWKAGWTYTVVHRGEGFARYANISSPFGLMRAADGLSSGDETSRRYLVVNASVPTNRGSVFAYTYGGPHFEVGAVSARTLQGGYLENGTPIHFSPSTPGPDVGDPIWCSQAWNCYDFIHFPMKVGDTWEGTMANPADRDGLPFLVKSRVLPARLAETPMGTVSAILVEHTLHLDENDMPASLEETATKNGAKITSFQMAQRSSIRIHYAPSLHHVISRELDVHVWLNYTSERAGYASLAKTHLHGSGGLDLVDATFQEVADAPMAQVWHDQMYPVRLTLDATRLDFDSGKEFHAQARFSPFASPGNAKIEMQLTGATSDGYLDKRIQGTSWTIAPPDPGTYLLRARGTRSPYYESQATLAWLHVDRSRSITAECPATVALAPQSCPAYEFGLGSSTNLTVSAKPDAPIDAFTSGQFVVEEPNGKTHATPVEDGVAELGFAKAAPGKWRAWFQPDAGARINVTYDMRATAT